jgi:hypothetical protein
MKETQIETVGKVFVVVCGMRRCLICERMFTPKQTADHAETPCHPRTTGSEPDEDTLDPCFPFLPPINSSSSPGQA